MLVLFASGITLYTRVCPCLKCSVLQLFALGHPLLFTITTSLGNRVCPMSHKSNLPRVSLQVNHSHTNFVLAGIVWGRIIGAA